MITTFKTLSPPLTFHQFLENLPDEEGRHELVNGQIMRILATRRHVKSSASECWSSRSAFCLIII